MEQKTHDNLGGDFAAENHVFERLSSANE